ncbi:hypothetical protein K7711_36380 [Nocardia sp. CA2R105]|uniref:hypothetical protein n=1 Tax=Nocardia coffeae TaxID=2873381 RepID=UPI001CA674E1|nr:hypothetical protein [Nocardia coffeae]MBY8862001.1 hypothetical protein [Nocardia coffeae]
MKISKGAFASTVLVCGVAPAVVMCVVNGFLPEFRDVVDPLGRPSQLSNELIDSAGQFDTLTSILVPKHAQLAAGVQELTPLSNDLTALTDKAGELSGHAIGLNADTATDVGIAEPLPGLLAKVTQRSDQASPTVAALTDSVGSVATQLQNIDGGLVAITATLGEVGVKSGNISSTLANVKEEAEHVREFGPLLAVVGPPVNSLNLPRVPFDAPPLPALPR